MKTLFRDASLSALVAGFVAVLVGFTSSVAIVFQAATALGASSAQISSWMWALGLGMGLCSLLPSLWLKLPVMVAWSTPGAAIVALAAASSSSGGVSGGTLGITLTAAPQALTLAHAVAAFMVSGALVAVAGFSGVFERWMGRFPMPLAQALLAGVLTRFALDAVMAFRVDAALCTLMLVVFLSGQRLSPRYAVLAALIAGIGYATVRGRLHWHDVSWQMATPVWVNPEFNAAAMFSLALPLFLVTMASQNLPGVAAIRAAGYAMPVSKLVGLTGVATFVLAPFGAFSLALSAITASICMSPQAHEDASRRYVAAAFCGLLYVVVGIWGAAVAGLLAAFPKSLVALLAGLALLGTIGHNLVESMRDEPHRSAALITFLVTLSGIHLLGVGSAFWGAVAGALSLFMQQWRPRRSA